MFEVYECDMGLRRAKRRLNSELDPNWQQIGDVAIRAMREERDRRDRIVIRRFLAALLIVQILCVVIPIFVFYKGWL